MSQGEIIRTFFWGGGGPYIKDYNVLGSILGYLNFGKLAYAG